MRWSFITSASGTTDVGSSAMKNHRMPNAIGRLSRVREATIAAASATATNINPTITRSSNGLAIGCQSASALRFAGATKLIA